LRQKEKDIFKSSSVLSYWSVQKINETYSFFLENEAIMHKKK
jgi:hypothetical protein